MLNNKRFLSFIVKGFRSGVASSVVLKAVFSVACELSCFLLTGLCSIYGLYVNKDRLKAALI